MLSTHHILSLCARKPALTATVCYVNAADEESVCTLTSVMEPEPSDKGYHSVQAMDVDLKRWRRFRMDRMTVLSVWEADADGKKRLVDPAKVMARAFATRLVATLERLICTNSFDHAVAAELSDALDDARRIAAMMKEVAA